MDTLPFRSRIRHAWNAFMNKDPTGYYRDPGGGSSYRPDRPRFSRGNERSIVTSVYNRIALDAAAIDIKHVRLDENERFLYEIDSPLNSCLSMEANCDQTGRAFIQDVVMSMLDEGCVAIVPVDTDVDPETNSSFDILSMRTGKILDWYPKYVRVRVYNDRTGQKEDIMLAKSAVAIVENPLYAVINEPNSTMQRLIRKLALLDSVDDDNASRKLDLIVQLPYIIKTEARRKQAEERRKDIERQLSGSKYGIAYTDGAERITQLNRPVENNLMAQIEYLTSMLYSQLGITTAILDGTADDTAMLNYYNRTIEPILSAIVDEMKRKFLTKTARTQKQSIAFFRDPFKLVPVSDLSEIADKFTRNEIMSSNEIRQVIGMKPSSDPKADELRNSNLSSPEGNGDSLTEEETGEESVTDEDEGMTKEEYEEALEALDDFDAQLDILEAELNEDEDELKHYASPYYDPVKAHEYYMRTRELKKKKSTAKLNEKGKNAARYVKEQLSNEKKSKIQANKEAMQGKIDRLREELKSMSKEERKSNKKRIQREIDSLRAANKAERERLKKEYESKYIAELEKMRADPEFQKVSKKSSGSGSKSKSKPLSYYMRGAPIR